MSTLTDLQSHWQNTLSKPEKSFWRQQLTTPAASTEELRHLIREKFGIDLQHDAQLYEFREWETAHHASIARREQAAHEKQRLAQEHPDWTLGQIQEELFRQICLQAALDPDDALALKGVRAAIRYTTIDLHREKFRESRNTKIKSGLDRLRKEAKNNSAIRAALDKLCEAVKTALPDEYNGTNVPPSSPTQSNNPPRNA